MANVPRVLLDRSIRMRRRLGDSPREMAGTDTGQRSARCDRGSALTALLRRLSGRSGNGIAWSILLKDIHGRPEGYTRSMTKRLVDVDDDKLDKVRALLGTSTTKATVNGALEEVLALAARRRALLDVEVVAGSADLAQDEQRRAAWA